MAMHIRLATPDDAEAIHAGLVGIGETVNEVHKIRSTPADIGRYGFGEKPAFTALIAEIDSEFAGMSLFFPVFSTWYGRPGGYVQDLFVVERFRGRGVADALLQRTAAMVRDAGGSYISLAVDKENSRAKAFYERLGMEVLDTDFHCMASGEAFDRLAEAGAETGEQG